MNKLYTAIAFIVLSACGGDLRVPDEVPPEFAGNWAGHAVVTMPPEITREYDTTLAVSVDGRVATLMGICPDGTGSASPFGFDGILAWTGSLMCEPSWLIGCAVRLEYTGIQARLSEDGRMSIMASGKAHRTPITDMTCDGFVVFSMDFTGDSRQ
jgi:hypothetical protein